MKKIMSKLLKFTLLAGVQLSLFAPIAVQANHSDFRLPLDLIIDVTGMEVNDVVRDPDPDGLFLEDGRKIIRLEDGTYAVEEDVQPTIKTVTVNRRYDSVSQAPEIIYYNQDGYYSYLPKTNFYPTRNGSQWVVSYSGALLRKGPGVNNP